MLCAAAHNTYIPTGEGWLFLASVLDLGSRRLIGYAMAEHMRTELVLDALNMAVTARGANTNVTGVITHADYAELCVKPRDRVLACGGGVR